MYTRIRRSTLQKRVFHLAEDMISVWIPKNFEQCVIKRFVFIIICDLGLM